MNAECYERTNFSENLRAPLFIEDLSNNLLSARSISPDSSLIRFGKNTNLIIVELGDIFFAE